MSCWNTDNSKSAAGSSRIDQGILEEAALWHATLGDEQATAKQRQACHRWRAENPDHERAFREIDRAFPNLDGLTSEFRPTAIQSLQQVFSKKRRHTSLPGLAALSLGLFWAASNLSIDSLTADYYADGQRQHITLSDGSEVTLNSGSSLDVRYSGQQRRLILKQGELAVQVAHDPSRPLTVETPNGTATALGTHYTVQTEAERMAVVVTESSVQLCNLPHSDCVTVETNQRALVQGGQVSTPEPVNTRLATAWTQGRLVVDDWPLEKLLDQLAGEHTGTLLFSASSLEGLRVSGVFLADNPQQALSHLEKTLPIRVRHFGSLLTLVTRN